ncbi:hypothetical protein J437_LFUL003715 [Ladona fulva]|uniref:G-protein coupled receptors family 1 profile domain-containing protein n=1 Tax=Ladona fulva TaxID=123851 RepID=A0A8K0JXP6_LADFU|nr:hypothetical protein J437_LFUL003715 [Ladona fulva]
MQGNFSQRHRPWSRFTAEAAEKLSRKSQQRFHSISSPLGMASLRLPESDYPVFEAQQHHIESSLVTPSSAAGEGPFASSSLFGSSADQETYQAVEASVAPPEVHRMGNGIVEAFGGPILTELGAAINGTTVILGGAAVPPLLAGIPISELTAMANSSNATASLLAERLPQELFYRHSLVMTVVYCVAYLVVFAVGLVGNSFVIAVVYRSPRMRTVTNYFIVNLAAADILVIVFCLPATLMSNIFVRELR